MRMADEALGRRLVGLQFVLLALMALLAAPAFVRGDAPTVAWALLVMALLLAALALSVNRPGNFNIRPTPKPGARLVRSGPYRWLRHPMYSSLLLAGMAALVGADLAMRPGLGAIHRT